MTITRKLLYGKVWQDPIGKLARAYGLSQAGTPPRIGCPQPSAKHAKFLPEGPSISAKSSVLTW